MSPALGRLCAYRLALPSSVDPSHELPIEVSFDSLLGQPDLIPEQSDLPGRQQPIPAPMLTVCIPWRLENRPLAPEHGVPGAHAAPPQPPHTSTDTSITISA